MIALLSVVALVKVGNGTAPPGHLVPSADWFNPFHHLSASGFMAGFTLMLFIYWGWDTAVSVNEETKDSHRIPGRAAVLSTVILLVTYALVILSAQAYAADDTEQQFWAEGDIYYYSSYRYNHSIGTTPSTTKERTFLDGTLRWAVPANFLISDRNRFEFHIVNGNYSWR